MQLLVFDEVYTDVWKSHQTEITVSNIVIGEGEYAEVRKATLTLGTEKIIKHVALKHVDKSELCAYFLFDQIRKYPPKSAQIPRIHMFAVMEHSTCMCMDILYQQLSPKMSVIQTLNCLISVCKLMQFLYESFNISHGDMHTGNIMYKSGVWYVIDFQFSSFTKNQHKVDIVMLLDDFAYSDEINVDVKKICRQILEPFWQTHDVSDMDNLFRREQIKSKHLSCSSMKDWPDIMRLLQTSKSKFGHSKHPHKIQTAI